MQADQLFTGGTVRTGVPGAQASTALAVAGGRVLALGQDALDAGGPRTEVTDLAGGALLPSFGDGHAHPLLGGLGLRGVPVRQARSVAEILAAVAAWAAAHPDAEWVTGDAFDPTLAARRPVRRPLAGPGGRRPAGGAAHDGPPHHVGQQRGAAPGRHRRGHPRAGRGPDRAPRGRLAAGHPARVGRHRTGAGPAPGARPGRAGRRPGRGLGAVRRRRDHLGPGRLGRPGPGGRLAGRPRPPACCGSAPTSRSGPSRPRGRTSSASSPPTGTGSAQAAPGWLTARTVKFFADGVVEGRHRRAAAARTRTARTRTGSPTGRRPSSPTRSPRPTRRASRPTCTPSATAGSGWPWTRSPRPPGATARPTAARSWRTSSSSTRPTCPASPPSA